MKQEQTKEWSPRSQRNLLERNELQLQLADRNSLIGATERKIAELETMRAGQLKRSLGGDTFADVALSRTLEELEEKKRLLAAYQEQRAYIEAQLRELDEPTPAAQDARLDQQARLAAMARERLEKDQEIDEAVNALRSLLQERGRLTAQMAEGASSIELDFSSPDDQRFEALLASLPEAVVRQSQAWAAWFIGERADEKPYIVRDDCLVVPETLAHHGVYFFGETLRLTGEEAAELSRTDRPAATRKEPWRCLPPSITTPEAYAAALAAAEEAGISVNGLYFREDSQGDMKNERRLKAGTPVLGAPTSGRFRSPEAARPLTVRVRAKSEISADRVYHAGETLELVEKEAWSLVRSGSAEPL